MTKSAAKKPVDRTHEYAGGRVVVKLRSAETTPKVFWSDRGNSYVAVQNQAGKWLVDDIPCDIVSVNGSGEVRWEVFPSMVRDLLTGEKAPVGGDESQSLAAVRHFEAFLAEDDPRNALTEMEIATVAGDAQDPELERSVMALQRQIRERRSDPARVEPAGGRIVRPAGRQFQVRTARTRD